MFELLEILLTNMNQSLCGFASSLFFSLLLGPEVVVETVRETVKLQLARREEPAENREFYLIYYFSIFNLSKYLWGV